MDGVERFSREVLKAGSAQICHEVGFHGLQLSTVETLADIAAKYVEEIGRSAAEVAALARRTAVNYRDVLEALAEYQVSEMELFQFARGSDELAFVADMPEFPIPRKVVLYGPSADLNMQGKLRSKDELMSAAEFEDQEVEREESVDHAEKMLHRDHIPSFLPEFPDVHTYQSSPIFPQRSQDANARRKLLIKQQRQVETSLVRLDKIIQGDPESRSQTERNFPDVD